MSDLLNASTYRESTPFEHLVGDFESIYNEHTTLRPLQTLLINPNPSLPLSKPEDVKLPPVTMNTSQREEEDKAFEEKAREMRLENDAALGGVGRPKVTVFYTSRSTVPVRAPLPSPQPSTDTPSRPQKCKDCGKRNSSCVSGNGCYQLRSTLIHNDDGSIGDKSSHSSDSESDGLEDTPSHKLRRPARALSEITRSNSSHGIDAASTVRGRAVSIPLFLMSSQLTNLSDPPRFSKDLKAGADGDVLGTQSQKVAEEEESEGERDEEGGEGGKAESEVDPNRQHQVASGSDDSESQASTSAFLRSRVYRVGSQDSVSEDDSRSSEDKSSEDERDIGGVWTMPMPRHRKRTTGKGI